MPLTLTNMLLFTRQLYVDVDTTNPALSDAELTKLINEAYLRSRDHFSPRWNWERGDVLGMAAGMAQSDRNVTPTILTVAEWKMLFVEAGATTTAGTPLSRDSVSRVTALQDSEGTEGTPRIYAAQRLETFTAAGVGKWVIHVWPIPSSTIYLSGLVRHEATELAVGTDKPDVQDGEAYTICRMAAMDAALISGRPVELVHAISAPLSDKLKSHLTVGTRSVLPAPKRSAAVA